MLPEFKLVLRHVEIATVDLAKPDIARPDNFNVLLVVLDGHATHDATLLDTVAELKTITSTIIVLSEHTGRSQIDEAYQLPHCVVLQDRPGRELTDLVARTCSEIRGGVSRCRFAPSGLRVFSYGDVIVSRS